MDEYSDDEEEVIHTLGAPPDDDDSDEERTEASPEDDSPPNIVDDDEYERDLQQSMADVDVRPSNREELLELIRSHLRAALMSTGEAIENGLDVHAINHNMRQLSGGWLQLQVCIRKWCPNDAKCQSHSANFLTRPEFADIVEVKDQHGDGIFKPRMTPDNRDLFNLIAKIGGIARNKKESKELTKLAESQKPENRIRHMHANNLLVSLIKLAIQENYDEKVPWTLIQNHYERLFDADADSVDDAEHAHLFEDLKGPLNLEEIGPKLNKKAISKLFGRGSVKQALSMPTFERVKMVNVDDSEVEVNQGSIIVYLDPARTNHFYNDDDFDKELERMDEFNMKSQPFQRGYDPNAALSKKKLKEEQEKAALEERKRTFQPSVNTAIPSVMPGTSRKPASVFGGKTPSGTGSSQREPAAPSASAAPTTKKSSSPPGLPRHLDESDPDGHVNETVDTEDQSEMRRSPYQQRHDRDDHQESVMPSSDDSSLPSSDEEDSASSASAEFSDMDDEQRQRIKAEKDKKKQQKMKRRKMREEKREKKARNAASKKTDETLSGEYADAVDDINPSATMVEQPEEPARDPEPIIMGASANRWEVDADTETRLQKKERMEQFAAAASSSCHSRSGPLSDRLPLLDAEEEEPTTSNMQQSIGRSSNVQPPQRPQPPFKALVTTMNDGSEPLQHLRQRPQMPNEIHPLHKKEQEEEARRKAEKRQRKLDELDRQEVAAARARAMANNRASSIHNQFGIQQPPMFGSGNNTGGAFGAGANYGQPAFSNPPGNSMGPGFIPPASTLSSQPMHGSRNGMPGPSEDELASLRKADDFGPSRASFGGSSRDLRAPRVHETDAFSNDSSSLSRQPPPPHHQQQFRSPASYEPLPPSHVSSRDQMRSQSPIYPPAQQMDPSYGQPRQPSSYNNNNDDRLSSYGGVRGGRDEMREYPVTSRTRPSSPVRQTQQQPERLRGAPPSQDGGYSNYGEINGRQSRHPVNYAALPMSQPLLQDGSSQNRHQYQSQYPDGLLSQHPHQDYRQPTASHHGPSQSIGGGPFRDSGSRGGRGEHSQYMGDRETAIMHPNSTMADDYDDRSRVNGRRSQMQHTLSPPVPRLGSVRATPTTLEMRNASTQSNDILEVVEELGLAAPRDTNDPQIAFIEFIRMTVKMYRSDQDASKRKWSNMRPSNINHPSEVLGSNWQSILFDHIPKLDLIASLRNSDDFTFAWNENGPQY